MKIGFIGGGKMASAMLKSLKISDVFVYAKSKNDEIAQKFGVQILSDEKEIAKLCDIVILAIKPKDYASVLHLISSDVDNKVIVSIAPNFSIASLHQMVKNDSVKIVRAMPNTPACVGLGTSAVCFEESLSDKQRVAVLEIFKSFGLVFELNQSDFAAFVGIAGSLPAYVFVFVEALADAAVLNGMSRDKAYKIAASAIFGSAKMILLSERHPAALKDDVCSPGGTTIQAIASLEKNGFRNAVIQAVNECVKKTLE